MKKIFRTLILLITVFSLSFTSASAQWSAQSLYQFLQKKYGGMNSVSLDFKNANMSNLSGSLTAKKGGYFKIDFINRIVAGDGKYIYNYSKSKNKVIKSLPGTIQEKSSLESIIFSFINDFSPYQLEKVQNSSGITEYVLILFPDKEIEYNIKSIRVWLDIETLELTALQINSGNHYQHWLISNMKVNPSFKKQMFEFVVPDGAELIDLTGSEN